MALRLFRPTEKDKAFRVRAEDGEDLAVVAAYLQDAVVPLAETTFEAREHRFVAIVSRFRWELLQDEAALDTAEDGSPLYQRVHTALRFENVDAVRSTNIDLRDRGAVLNLLSMALIDDGEDRFVDLVFAEGATIRLDVARLACHVEDLGEPWTTPFRPDHPAEATDSAPPSSATGQA